MTEKPLFNSGGGRIENKKIYTQERKKNSEESYKFAPGTGHGAGLGGPGIRGRYDYHPE